MSIVELRERPFADARLLGDAISSQARVIDRLPQLVGQQVRSLLRPHHGIPYNTVR